MRSISHIVPAALMGIDVDRLLAHSRFRGDRFGRSELTLEGSPGQSSRGLASHLTDWLT